MYEREYVCVRECECVCVFREHMYFICGVVMQGRSRRQRSSCQCVSRQCRSTHWMTTAHLSSYLNASAASSTRYDFTCDIETRCFFGGDVCVCGGGGGMIFESLACKVFFGDVDLFMCCWFLSPEGRPGISDVSPPVWNLRAVI